MRPLSSDGHIVPSNALDGGDDTDAFARVLEASALLDVQLEVGGEGIVGVGSGSCAQVGYP